MKSFDRSVAFRTVSSLLLLLFISGCFATATVQGPPVMERRPGDAPTAAMLPILNTNDPNVSRHITDHLQNCLQTCNAFKFAPKEAVEQAVAQSGFDMKKIFGLNDSEYKALAAKLGVDYVIHGVISVKKSLKFNGWRKDIDAYIKLHNGSTGAKVDSWRSVTDFTWTDAVTDTDARKMGESAANHICQKMLQSSF